MRLGISSYTYVWAVGVPGYPRLAEPMSALDLFDKADALGFRVRQVADNLPLDELSDDDLTTFAKRTGKLGIDLEVGTQGIARSRLLTYVEIATRLQSPILRTVTDQRHAPSNSGRRRLGAWGPDAGV